MEVIAKGLKCDNPNCNWSDESIELKDMDKWLNAPCPLCGQPVLTQQDYNIMKVFQTLQSSKVFQAMDAFADAHGAEKKHFSVTMDGTGKVGFTEVSDKDVAKGLGE